MNTANTESSENEERSPIIFYYTEYLYDLNNLDKDDYTVSFINFSDKEESSRPRFMADFISIGKHIQKEKLQDCLDLIEI